MFFDNPYTVALSVKYNKKNSSPISQANCLIFFSFDLQIYFRKVWVEGAEAKEVLVVAAADQKSASQSQQIQAFSES
jgi:hypothetical protein